MPHITKFGKYVLERFDAPLHCDLAKAIDKLCNGFGDHYKNYFGPDFIERMTNSTGGAIVSVAYLEDSNFVCADDIIEENGNLVLCAAASILYDPDHPQGASTLHNVFTHIEHRRQGLSKMLVKKVLNAYDQDIGGSFCVLGTGSPFAAKTYKENGFGHLAGGFDTNGPKGYNPDDLGEWIMIRPSNFDPSSYYSLSQRDQLEIMPLKNTHYTQLVLLFNAQEETYDYKCQALDIKTGVQAEEKLIKFFQSIKFKKSATPSCYVAVVGTRIYGIGICRDGTTNKWDTYACLHHEKIEGKLREKLEMMA